MAMFRLRRFSRPESLKAIAPEQLIAFLRPYERYFASRGVMLPPACSAEKLDYSGLVKAFLSPDSKTPQQLIDALYLVDEMATPEGMDALLDEVARQNLMLTTGSDHSPEDVAVQVWLLKRDILERKHAEHHLEKARSFASYQMDRFRRPEFKRPSNKQLEALTSDLDDWFEAKKRGRGVRVIICEKNDGVWFLVRHGEPFKREESLDGAEASSVSYRPLKYDVLVYSPIIGELRINARSKGEKQMYCTKFGKHLFGDEDIFPGTEKYTLDPLRERGKDSLATVDIEGIDWVKLREIQWLFGGNPWEVITRKSDDYFALLKSRNKPFPVDGRIIKATFQVMFSDAKTPRSVIIKPPNVAQFTRDDDSVPVEKWLEARGFILNEESGGSEQTAAVLAGS
jgi:hypothetical protein